jgi:hypothetical protein
VEDLVGDQLDPAGRDLANATATVVLAAPGGPVMTVMGTRSFSSALRGSTQTEPWSAVNPPTAVDGSVQSAA